MNKTLLSLATVAALALSACQPPSPPQAPNPPTPPAAPGATTASVDANGHAIPQSEIGRRAAEGMVEARKQLATGNISISGNHGIKFKVGGVDFGADTDKLPKAEISPAGDLIVEGKQIAATPAQRTLLLEYRNQIIGIANAGMNIGVHGADLASEAISGIPGIILGGEEAEKRFEQKMEAKGKEMEAQGQLLCNNLAPMMQTQEKLAAIMPEFKPYANLTQASIDDCNKKN